MGSYGSDNFYPTFDKKINVVKNVDTSAPQLCRVPIVVLILVVSRQVVVVVLHEFWLLICGFTIKFNRRQKTESDEIMKFYTSNTEVHIIDDHQLLLLTNHPDEIYFSGFLNVKPLFGSVEIMGFKTTPSQPSVMAFSVKENCFLKISTLDSGSNNVFDKSCLHSLNLSANLIREILSKSSISHSILLTKNSTNILPILKSYNMPIFLKENIDGHIKDSLKPDVTKYRTYQDLDDWNSIFHTISNKSNPRTVLCGGLGVGKSTLLKFLLNKSLGRWSEVIVIDLDPGQPEFTVMGCLSVVSVKQPVIGPNFSHLKNPEKSLFFGDISVTNSAEEYTRCVEKLVDFCRRNFSQVPWFINTMGFATGLGVKLLFEIVENTCPTDVIQITCSKKSNNFPRALLPKFWREEEYTSSKSLKYDLHYLPSVVRIDDKSFDVTACGLNSATKRNIVTLSYFSQVIHSFGNLSSTIPRKIPLDSVKISIDKSSSDGLLPALNEFQKLCCINANMVALCRSEDLLEWIGYGVVRGFDEDAEELAIITPLSDAQLLQVDTICMSSSIQLPDIVYRKQADPSRSHVPYVMRISKDMLHQRIKKSSSRIRYFP